MSCALVGFESKLLSTDVHEISYHLYISPVAVLFYVLQVRTWHWNVLSNPLTLLPWQSAMPMKEYIRKIIPIYRFVMMAGVQLIIG